MLNLKNIIANATIKLLTLDYIKGSDNGHHKKSELEKRTKSAIRKINSLGIDVIEFGSFNLTSPIAFVIDENSKEVRIVGTFMYGTRIQLINLVERFDKLGIDGVFLVKAAVDAFKALDDSTRHQLMDYKNGYQPAMRDYIESLLRSIGFGPNVELTAKTVSALVYRLGGYKGCREVAADALTAIANKQAFKKDLCRDCKHCRYDSAGNRYCAKVTRSLPNNLTAEAIANLYSSVKISKKGHLMSEYTPVEMSECDWHVARR